MPVPSTISSLSQTAASNSPAGSDSPTVLDDHLRAAYSFIAGLRDGQGFSNPVDLASAATTNIGAQTSPVVRITGTTTITSFGTSYNGPRFLVFAGALTLTHNATSLILPGGANIVTAAGDAAIVVPNLATPTGWRVVSYLPAALVPGAVSSIVPISLGGTGQGTAAGAFAALKQAATDTTTGVVELATAAEAPVRTNTNVVLTPATLRDALVAQNDAPIFACRAWVNFNGTGTVAIRASGNVSSITDNNTGNYTVNFTTAMPDANYATIPSNGRAGVNAVSSTLDRTTVKVLQQNAGSVIVATVIPVASADTTVGGTDVDQIGVAIFR